MTEAVVSELNWKLIEVYDGHAMRWSETRFAEHRTKFGSACSGSGENDIHINHQVLPWLYEDLNTSGMYELLEQLCLDQSE